MSVVSLVVGDWSSDGHSQSDKYLFKVGDTQPKLEVLYENGIRNLGLPNVHSEYAEEYQDCNIPHEIAAQLHRAVIDVHSRLLHVGFSIDDLGSTLQALAEYVKEQDVALTPNIWVVLYIAIVLSGKNVDFIEIKKINEDRAIHIGGYGLYE